MRINIQMKATSYGYMLKKKKKIVSLVWAKISKCLQCQRNDNFLLILPAFIVSSLFCYLEITATQTIMLFYSGFFLNKDISKYPLCMITILIPNLIQEILDQYYPKNQKTLLLEKGKWKNIFRLPTIGRSKSKQERGYYLKE